MSGLNYLKLDFRLMKGTLRFFLLMPIVFLIFFLKESPIMGLGYVFFFLIIVAATPFSVESNEKCDKMYYMLPSKVSSMVLGRFLFLIVSLLVVWIIEISSMSYLYNTGRLGILEISIIAVSGVAATIMCLIQYPIYYKFGMEKGKIISMVVYMLPAFIIFAMPSLLKENKLFLGSSLSTITSFVSNNKSVLPWLAIIIICILGIVSYLISVSICKKKEI